MFNSLKEKKTVLGMTLIALAFGIVVGIKSAESFGTCILITIGYAWGFILGGLSMYLLKSEKFNTWLSSKLFWRRGKNV